ncbi:MAG: tetratricopeptide repeat protein, partial [Lysobacteraceae bacterium]
MTSIDGNEGMRLLHAGQPAQALPLLLAAQQASPDDRRLLHGLGSAMLASGQVSEAIILYQQTAERLPDDAGILANWGGALLASGDREGAIAALQRALAIDPLRHDAGAMMGRLLRDASEFDAACKFLQPIAAAHPGYADVVWEYGQALMAAERLTEAQVEFERLLELQPRHAHAHVALAKIAISCGVAARAIELLRNALEIEPGNVHAWRELVHAQDGELEPEKLPQLLQHTQAETDPWRQAMFHDALVRHFDRTGNYPKAAGHAVRANALRAPLQTAADRYDPAPHALFIDNTIRDFDAPLFKRLRGSGSLDRRPVFVLGLPRSGTTLFEQMLAAHPQIVGVGEQQFASLGMQQALAESVTSGQLLTPAAVDHAARWHLGALADRLSRLGGSRRAERVV